MLCVLELRARFDEQNNIDYATMLEEAGCTVIYGLSDYKIHAKLCLITRKVHNQIQYITQVGTGNYNEKNLRAVHRPFLYLHRPEDGRGCHPRLSGAVCR